MLHLTQTNKQQSVQFPEHTIKFHNIKLKNYIHYNPIGNFIFILFFVRVCSFSIFFNEARIYWKPTWWNRSNWVGIIIINKKWELPLGAGVEKKAGTKNQLDSAVRNRKQFCSLYVLCIACKWALPHIQLFLSTIIINTLPIVGCEEKISGG